MVGIPTYSGIFFAELSMLDWVQSFAVRRTILNKAITISLLIIGLFLLSFPNSHPEWAPWFNPIVEFGKVWYPEGSNQFSITLYAGVFLMLASILLSTSFQWFLVRPVFLWRQDFVPTISSARPASALVPLLDSISRSVSKVRRTANAHG